jgi:hypothetical protein
MLDTSENGGLGSLSRGVLLDIVFRCYEEASRVSAFRSRRPHFGAEAICRSRLVSFARLGDRESANPVLLFTVALRLLDDSPVTRTFQAERT